MAENNLKAKKDLGSPIGIILGIIVFIIGVALQDETFTIYSVKDRVTYSTITSPYHLLFTKKKKIKTLFVCIT